MHTPPTHRAPLSRAAWQSGDARSDEDADVANDDKKKPIDELMSKPEPQVLAAEEGRNRSVMLTQPCTHTTAQTRTAQTPAWLSAHTQRADSWLRRSTTRPTTTHGPAIAIGLLVRLHRRKP